MTDYTKEGSSSATTAFDVESHYSMTEHFLENLGYRKSVVCIKNHCLSVLLIYYFFALCYTVKPV